MIEVSKVVKRPSACTWWRVMCRLPSAVTFRVEKKRQRMLTFKPFAKLEEKEIWRRDESLNDFLD